MQNLKNLITEIYRDSILAWDRRVVFGAEAPDATDQIAQLEQMEIAENEKSIDEQVRYANNQPAEMKKRLTGVVNSLAGDDQENLFNVLDAIRPNFNTVESRLQYATDINNLIDHIQTDLADGKLDQNYDSMDDLNQILTGSERRDLITGFGAATINLMNLPSFELQDWQPNIGEVLVSNFSDATQNELFNLYLVESKGNELSMQQFIQNSEADPKSKWYELIIQWLDDVLGKLEVKNEEKVILKRVVSWIPEYTKLAQNENLQDILSRHFDITQDTNAKITLIDLVNPRVEITKTKMQTTIKTFLDSFLKDEENQDTILRNKNLAEKAGITFLDYQINKAQKSIENGEENEFSLGKLMRMCGEFMQAFTDGNWEKFDAVLMGMKLPESSSKTNKFNLTFKEGKKPTRATIFGFMKGKNVTINKGEKNEKVVKIEKESQIGEPKYLSNGEVEITVNEKEKDNTKEGEKISTPFTLENNTASNSELLNRIQKGPLKIGSLEDGKNVNFNNNNNIDITKFKFNNAEQTISLGIGEVEGTDVPAAWIKFKIENGEIQPVSADTKDERLKKAFDKKYQLNLVGNSVDLTKKV